MELAWLLADWDYGDRQLLLNGLGNDWKMFIRLACVKENKINTCIANNLNVEDQARQLLCDKLNDCQSFCWNHVQKILQLLEQNQLISELENKIKSNGSGVEDGDGKCLEENNPESKTLMFFITAKHIASCWESIGRSLGLKLDEIEAINKESYCDQRECAYQVLLERNMKIKIGLQWDDIQSAIKNSDLRKSRSDYLLKKIKEDCKKHISSFQERPIEKDEQRHPFLTPWNVVITSHMAIKDIKELGMQVDETLSDTKNQKPKCICLFDGANSIPTLYDSNQWNSKCGDYVEKYYGNIDFFTFNYDTNEVPHSFKDFLEKNQPSFLIKDYSLYKHFELLEMLSSLPVHQREELQRMKMDHIGFEAKNKSIYFFKVSIGKTVHDIKQDIDDCALYVRMFLLLHKNDLEGIIACLMSFIVIPTEFEGLINDITDNVCNNCKQYVITMNQFLNFDKLLSKDIKATIKKTTKANWKELKYFDFKSFKHNMQTIFGVMAIQEGNLIPSLSNDTSEQLDNVRIFLYPQQVSIGNSYDKHVLLKGGHGSGKTIVGRILLKKIISEFPNEILYYINFASSVDFTEDMKAYVNRIGCNNNVICCDRTRFQNNGRLSEIVNEIEREHMPTSQIHLIFDEVSLDEFGENDIISFCDVLNQPPYEGAYCLIICQAMTKQRTLKENGVTHKISFMDQTQRLIEQSSFREKTLNEVLRYTAKIDKLVKIAREHLEPAFNKFSNEEIEKKETGKIIPMLRKSDEDPPESNNEQEPDVNSAANEVPLETDTLGEKSLKDVNKALNQSRSLISFPIALTQIENKVETSVFNFDADVKKVNPAPVNTIHNGKIIESQYHYDKDSKVLHNLKVKDSPRLYFPFEKKNSFSPFENVYLMMLCFEHLFESRYIDSDEKIVVIHLDDETPVVLLKALKLYENLEERNFENIEFKKCLDVQGAEYKNVIIFFSVAEYHMRHFLVEAMTRCKCNLVFFVMKEKWEFAKKEVLWKLLQIWLNSIDNEEQYITACCSDDLNYTNDDLIKFQALHENELDEMFSESSDDREKAAENLAKSMKNLGIAEEDSDDEDEDNDHDDEDDDGSNGDNGGEGDNNGGGGNSGSASGDQNTPGSANYREERIKKFLIKKKVEISKNSGSNNPKKQSHLLREDTISDEDDEDGGINEYDMQGDQCGRCIIINQNFHQPVKTKNGESWLKSRDGTKVDVARLQIMYIWLKFEVTVYDDMTKDELESLFKKEASDKRNYSSKCLIVCILSHGKEGGIYTADGDFYNMQEILDLFDEKNCKSLICKPKLFFIQACQKSKDGIYVQFDKPGATEDEDKSYQSPKKAEKYLAANADQFVFFSSTPGNVSWRSPIEGSWFIQTVCSVFEKSAHKKNFYELVLQINNRIAKRGQKLADTTVASMMSSVGQNTLRKIVRFHPDKPFKDCLFLIEK